MATQLGTVLADFTTSLSTALAIGGTSATLQSATDDDAVALPAGRYFFTIDGGNSSKEHISCSLSGTALTSIKSVSRQGVETSGVVRAHRIGATVMLTDFAHLKYMNDLLAGTTTLNAAIPLGYDGAPTISTGNQLATKTYVDGVAVAGAPNADTTTKGIVEKATQAEVQAGTDTGATGASLFVPAANNGARLYMGYAADAGSTDTYVITLAPVPSSLADGMTLLFKAATANTGACTLNVNSLGAIALKVNGADPLDGFISANARLLVQYDGTNFNILSCSNNVLQVPVASVQMYCGAAAPTGWLLCDGTAVSRTTYSALFGILSTTYGAGDASTTFNVPDMRGRVPVGVGTGAGGGAAGTGAPTGGDALTAVARAGWKGAETHVLTTTEMPAHTHNLTTYNTNANGTNNPCGSNNTANPGTVATASAGSDGAHNNIQPQMGINFIIKT